MNNIPFSAWDQAVFVVLFALLVVAVIGAFLAFTRWMLAWATKREQEWQAAAARRDKDWQGFIMQLREQGAASRAVDLATNTEEHGELKSAIATLADAITALTRKFEMHETIEFERFDALFQQIGRRRSDHLPPSEGGKRE